MSDLLDTMKISASGMQAQTTRLRHVSENIANVDTPGFRRKLTAFEEVRGDDPGLMLVRNGPVELDQSELDKIYDPAHPLADETGHYDGSNVNLLIEVADAREAQRSYEANLKMFDQARQMTAGLFDLLRK